MLHYFPFDNDHYAMTMNAKAGVDKLIEVDKDEYTNEIRLKSSILAEDYRYHFQCHSSYEAAAWETVALLLRDMASCYPKHFSLLERGTSWTWSNRLLKTETAFTFGDCSSLPFPPLDWIGRQVQEDLILMEQDESGNSVCIAGQLCFPSAWCLDDKLGLSFLRIHDVVPEFSDRIGRSSDLMMRRLKVHRPTSRLNWTISASSARNQAPRVREKILSLRKGITAENAGERCFLRTERQTLSRLPRSKVILFTIHTYINSVAEVVSDPVRRKRFASVVKGIPPQTVDYKGMSGYADALVAYLEG